MYARASSRSGSVVVDASAAIAAAVILCRFARGVDGDAVVRRGRASRGARARAGAVAARAASDMTRARSPRRGVWVDGGRRRRRHNQSEKPSQLSNATMIE